MKEPRPYKGERDLEAMHALLVAGRAANNGTYYIHPGDLNWWLYYPPLEYDFWNQIYMWDDPEHVGRLLGWVLFTPDWVGIDVYTQPELKGCSSAAEMYAWAEEQALEMALKAQKKTLHVVWVRHEDELLRNQLEENGYRLGKGYVQLARSIAESISTVQLADGFTVRSCAGVAEVTARAQAQYGSFASSAPFERYVQRFTRFMCSPAYQPERDIVAVSPEGAVGAFCIVWLDAFNKVGHFEPVGTHPDFQRKGLARAVVNEGLHRLREAGMNTADVITSEDNSAAIKFYEAVGFQIVNRLGTFEKDV